ncbi:MAG: arginine--tRNA ligase, partial [Marinicella sp.]
MIGHIQELIENALEHLQAKGEFNLDQTPTINIERTRNKDHGDYASNVALTLAKPLKLNPRAIAEKIIAELTDTSHVKKVEIAGPGFINFYLTDACRLQVLK